MAEKNAADLMRDLGRLLCPPGDGVYTVHTAREKKQALQESLFATSEASEVRKQWLESLNNADLNSRVALLGICSDTGGGIHRGANWGPLFIRNELLSATNRPDYLDAGDVRVIPHLLHDKYLNQATISHCHQALYGSPNISLPVSPLAIAEKCAKDLYAAYPQLKIFGLGGDHSCSYPLVKSYVEHRRSLGKKVAVLQFDAHTDLMERRLGIDICFASWTFHILPMLEDASHLIQVGIRSTGQSKQHWESTLGVRQFWADEIRSNGAFKVARSIKEHFSRNEIDEFYVSFDIDALDSSIAGTTGTPEPNGIFVDECVEIIQALSLSAEVGGADMMEVAPFVTFPSNGVQYGGTQSTIEAAAHISAALIGMMNSR